MPRARGFAASSAGEDAVGWMAFDRHRSKASMDVFDALALARRALAVDVLGARRAECSFLREVYPDERLKTYVIERKTVSGQIGARACAWRALRAALLGYQRPVLRWIDEVERRSKKEDETGEEMEWPEFDYVEPMRETVRAFARETAVGLTRLSLQRAVIARSSERLAAKLCKDVRRSARRKAQRVSWERGMGKFAQARNMFRTTALARCVDVSGEWLFDVGLAAWISRSAAKKTGSWSKKTSRALRRAIVRSSCKAAATLFGGAAFSAGFALCRPRGARPSVVHWGTYAALIAGELIFNLFVAPTIADAIQGADDADEQAASATTEARDARA